MPRIAFYGVQHSMQEDGVYRNRMVLTAAAPGHKLSLDSVREKTRMI